MKQTIKIQNYAGIQAYFSVKTNEQGYFEPVSNDVSDKIKNFMFTEKTKGFDLVKSGSFFHDLAVLVGILPINRPSYESNGDWYVKDVRGNHIVNKLFPNLILNTKEGNVLFKYNSSIDAFAERNDTLPKGADVNLKAWYGLKRA